MNGTKSVIAPTSRRVCKIKLAARGLMAQPFADSTIERLVGHMAFVALLRRESLSCFEVVYDFILAGHLKPVRVPESVTLLLASCLSYM